MWNCCFVSKNDTRLVDNDNPLFSEVDTPEYTYAVVNCAKCNGAHSILNAIRAYICPKCFAVNTIADDSKQQTVVDINQYDVLEIPFTSRAFESTDSRASSSGSSLPEIAICSVCMEEPGDVIMIPCRHGAVCQDCAKFILGNNAVGGQKCPKCRQQISQIVKMAQVTCTSITAVQLQVTARSGPPKVPPPPGSRKKQVSLGYCVKQRGTALTIHRRTTAQANYVYVHSPQKEP